MSSIKTQALLRRVAATSAPERSFWKAVARLAQEPRPNWGLDIHPEREPLSNDAFVYLVDTSNLWIAAAAMGPDRLLEEMRVVQESEILGRRALAAESMRRASEAQTSHGESFPEAETLHAFATGVLAIAAAPEFLVVAEQAPQLDNYHWILLLYRLADGELATGFGYVDDPIPGMLEREQLLEYVRSLVEMDLEPRAAVGQLVQKHGGVEIADVLANRHPGRS